MADWVRSERMYSTQVSRFKGRSHGCFVEALRPSQRATYGTQRELFHEKKKRKLTGKIIGTGAQIDDISAIFDVTQREYNSGSVSWGSGRGYYYIHRVDREGYIKIRQKLESGRPMRSRR